MTFDTNTALTHILGASHISRTFVFIVDEDMQKIIEALKENPKFEFKKKRPLYTLGLNPKDVAYYDEIVDFLFEGFMDIEGGVSGKDIGEEIKKSLGVIPHPYCPRLRGTLWGATKAVVTARQNLEALERLLEEIGGTDEQQAEFIARVGGSTVAELREELEVLIERQAAAQFTVDLHNCDPIDAFVPG